VTPSQATERALGSALDDRAIGHRVGERHAEFEHIGAGAHQRVHQRHRHLRRRIARRYIRNKRTPVVPA